MKRLILASLALSVWVLPSLGEPPVPASTPTPDDLAAQLWNAYQLRADSPGEAIKARRRLLGQDKITREVEAFSAENKHWLTHSQFDLLENRVNEIRATRAIHGNGIWKIASFYDSFEPPGKSTEEGWKAYEGHHQQWIAAKPASIAARVAYAYFLTDYAWYARGGGFAHTVTQESWQTFRERLETGWKVLQEARSLTEKDPFWWVVAQRTGLGLQWDRSRIEVLLKEARTFDPKFYRYDTAYSYYLLPRWYGRPGEWEAYAEECAARPDVEGVESYVRIVLLLNSFYQNIYSESKASWPHTKRGLESLLKKYPDSLEVLNQAAMLAALAQDRAMAKPLFEQIGERCVTAVWNEKYSRFVAARDWAIKGG